MQERVISLNDKCKHLEDKRQGNKDVTLSPVTALQFITIHHASTLNTNDRFLV